MSDLKKNQDFLDEIESTAYNYLSSGSTQACSQTVLLTLQEKYYGEVNEQMIQACGPMAGGSRVGSLCGALVGGLLAIGMRYGTPYERLYDEETHLASYEKAKVFYKDFEEIAGSWYCPNIVGYDLDIPEEREKWIENNGKIECAKLCGKVAKKTAEILLADHKSTETEK